MSVKSGWQKIIIVFVAILSVVCCVVFGFVVMKLASAASQLHVAFEVAEYERPAGDAAVGELAVATAAFGVIHNMSFSLNLSKM